MQKHKKNEKSQRHKRLKFTAEQIAILKDWFKSHIHTEVGPYPNKDQKQHFVKQTGLGHSQIDSWFINQRGRNNEWRRVNIIKKQRKSSSAHSQFIPLPYHNHSSPSPLHSSSSNPSHRYSQSHPIVSNKKRRR